MKTVDKKQLNIRTVISIPPSFYKAAGLLRGKTAGLKRHIAKVRKEWR